MSWNFPRAMYQGLSQLLLLGPFHFDLQFFKLDFPITNLFAKLFMSVNKLLSQGPVRGPLDALAQAYP